MSPAINVRQRQCAWHARAAIVPVAIVGAEQLELLDRSGLLVVRTDGRRQQVTLAHPLYGEILLACLLLLMIAAILR